MVKELLKRLNDSFSKEQKSLKMNAALRCVVAAFMCFALMGSTFSLEAFAKSTEYTQAYDLTYSRVASTKATGSTASIASKNTSATYVYNYLKSYKKLPNYYITKSQAKKLGWVDSKGNLDKVAPGKAIGGDVFSNREGKLPKKSGRTYREADLNYKGGYRGGERIIYSNDGLYYVTTDHYNTFTKMGK